MRLPVPAPARATVVLLGWVAAAIVAGVIGVTAIGAVGDGIVGSSTTPLSAQEVDQRLAAREPGTAQTPTPVETPSAAPSTPSGTAPVPAATTDPPTEPPPVVDPPPADPPPTEPPPPSDTKLISTDGGSVLTRCQGASPQIVSVTPAQGFRAERDPDDGEGEARVEFESERLRVRIDITCADGEPTWTVETDD